MGCGGGLESRRVIQVRKAPMRKSAEGGFRKPKRARKTYEKIRQRRFSKTEANEVSEEKTEGEERGQSPKNLMRDPSLRSG